MEAPAWAKEDKAGGRPPKYAFKKMELYAVISLNPEQLPPSGYGVVFKNMLYSRGISYGMKFVSRQLENGIVEVCRVK